MCEEGGQVLTKLRTSHARCTKWGYSNTLIYLFWFRRQLQIVKLFGLHLNINLKLVTLAAFVLLFSAVRFQMCPQITCLRRGKVALVAFIRLFSTVRFQMSPQITCLNRGKVTLATFVWLFSTVRFQMCPQMYCSRRDIFTLVAFVWLFSTVHF